MKIAVISTSVVPSKPYRLFSGYGGLERVAGSLSEAFAKRGHEVILVGCQGSQADGCKVVELPRGIPEDQALQQYLPHIADCDIWFDNTWSHFPVMPLWQEPEKYKKSHIMVFHHGVLGDIRTAPPIAHANWICASNAQSQYISSTLGIPTRFVHHGIDTEVFKPTTGARDDYWLILSRLSPEKGIHESLRILKEKGKNVVLIADDQIIADQCLPPGTYVYGETPKRIEEIVTGDKVLTRTGGLGRVIRTSSRLYHGALIKLEWAYGGTVECTPEHPILVRRVSREFGVPRTRVEWLPASNIQVGDWVFKPAPILTGWKEKLNLHKYLSNENRNLIIKDGKWRYKSAHTSVPSMNGSLSLTPALMRLFGYFIADGHSTNGRVIITFHKDQHDYVDDAVRLGAEVGVRPKVVSTGNVSQVVYDSKLLSRLLLSQFGRHSHERRLPEWIAHCGVEEQRALLVGYWRGDGSRKIGDRFVMDTVSPVLARQIEALLASNGIVAGATPYDRGDGTRPRFLIRVATCYSERFANLLGVPRLIPHLLKSSYLIAVKKRGRHGLRAGAWVQVRSVASRTYSGKVYNLEVAPTNTFVAEGIVVHNSYARRIMQEVDGRRVRFISGTNLPLAAQLMWMQSAKAMIHCPLSPWIEIGGLAVMEAGAVGLPVLATRNGAMPETIEHGKTGFLADHPDGLVEFIDRVGEIDPAACRRRIVENFTVEKSADGHLALMADIMSGNEW